MGISQLERSNYYKGLLILTGKDRVIDARERDLMIRFGRILDFDVRFCEAAMDGLLDNRYITDEPIVFSSRETAECFLRDGIRIALTGSEIHPKELKWLRLVAHANGLSREWLDSEIERLRAAGGSGEISGPFAVEECLK